MPSAVERYLSNLPYIAAQRGAAWDYGVRRVFAADPDVDTAFADVWEGAGDIHFPAATAPLELVSDSASDAAAGTGARTVTVEGLGGLYQTVSEVVTLSGTTPVATAGGFLRVNRVRVETAGSLGQPAGTLSVRALGAGPVLAVVRPGPYNVGLSSAFTVPRDRTAYIVSAKYSSDDVTTRFHLMLREPGGIFRTLEVFQTGVTPVAPMFAIPVEVQEKTDVKVIAQRPTSETALALVTYDMLIMPKTLSAVRSLGKPAT